MRTVIGYLTLGIWCAAIGGYIANIVKFIGMINDPLTNMFIARAVGLVLAPLGAVLGWF